MNEIRIYLKEEMTSREAGIGTYYMTFMADGEWREPPESEKWLEIQRKRCRAFYVKQSRMEVMLLTLALRELKGKSRVEVFCETQYLAAYIRNWMPLWKEKGWKMSNGEAVAPEFLELDAELQKHELKDITEGRHEYYTGLETELHSALHYPQYGVMLKV